MEAFVCLFCRKSYPVDPFHPLCPACQEPLLFKGPAKDKKFHRNKNHPLEVMLDFLPLDYVNLDLSLGEGNTPLIRLKNVEKDHNLPSLFAKNETVNPTHSFKDRGTAVAIQKAVSLGIKKIGTVSTGNMAASTAAYGAKANIETLVLVKDDTPQEKLQSIGLHNALMVKVEGDYGELFRKSLSLAPQVGIYFMNSVDPFRLEGYKVTGFEIYFQLEQQAPDYIFVPVSAGGHLVGIIRAFQELKKHGFIRKYHVCPTRISHNIEWSPRVCKTPQASAHQQIRAHPDGERAENPRNNISNQQPYQAIHPCRSIAYYQTC